jgi:phage shock protein E
MKILVRLAVVTFLSFGVISCTDAQSSSGATAEKEEQGTVSKDVDVKTFKTFVDKNDGTILDVRTVREIVSGKIKGAVHIDYYAADFMSQVAKLDKSKPVYVYCASGGRSGGAMRKMLNLGFPAVYNLSGGMGAWKASDFPVE